MVRDCARLMRAEGRGRPRAQLRMELLQEKKPTARLRLSNSSARTANVRHEVRSFLRNPSNLYPIWGVVINGKLAIDNTGDVALHTWLLSQTEARSVKDAKAVPMLA
jgi:hypothetical protein